MTCRRDETLQATCRVLEAAGFTYTYSKTGSGHYRVIAPGLPPIICSVSSSDYRADKKAASLARRLIKQHTQRGTA